jgi:hypothetical protein
MSQEESLEVPWYVNVAAGLLGVGAAFMVMMGVQFAISGVQGLALGMTASYFVVGLLGLVMAAMAARGKTWGAVGGAVSSVLIVGLCWTPTLFGVFAFTTLGSGGFAGLALLPMVVSIPACMKVSANRVKLLEGA